MNDRRFMTSFILLSLTSGVTVGLGKVVTTLYALQLGASPFQVGIVSAMESVGMILVTVPAGFLIARYGARSIYFAASMGPLLVNLAMPFSASWLALALGRWLIGLCIPFRMVSMNSAFLERLRGEGETRGGWYRGSLTAGLSILGPAAAALLAARGNVTVGFALVSALFGLMAVFSLSFLPVRDSVAAGSARPGFLAEIGLLLRDLDVADTCIVEFLNAATSALFGTFIILLALSLPPLGEQDGIRLMLVQGATATVMLFAAGTIVQRLARGTAYALGLALGSLALLAFGLGADFASLALGAVLLSAGAAIVHLVNVRMLAGLPGGKSKVAGLYNLASMTGSSAGALGGGLLTKILPLQAVFLLWLPLLLAGAAAVGLIRRRTPSTLAASEA
ncbi:MFS transporter [Sphingosinicella sp. BN140058]|uniref:MFS transporter n=1 Tax=Sphingosinicella sp. BN140058 TaxID=1892855 RepID=UPI001012A8A9|nr:MFS transporter [Sphingosinicella sp. BN140058]QAY76047.1 MFS transporter [Sphingosinicella sp. BN140058]